MNKFLYWLAKFIQKTDLFPNAFPIQKAIFACLQLIIILLLVMLFQIYDNHKDINNKNCLQHTNN